MYNAQQVSILKIHAFENTSWSSMYISGKVLAYFCPCKQNNKRRANGGVARKKEEMRGENKQEGGVETAGEERRSDLECQIMVHGYSCG